MLDAAQGIPFSKRWHKAPVGLAVEPWPHLEGCSNLAVTPLARATPLHPSQFKVSGLARLGRRPW